MLTPKQQNRISEMRHRLTEHLEPKSLIIRDDSAHHSGHAGAKTGLGHFSVEIISHAFTGKSQIERHKLIYQALGNMMQTDIHALQVICAKAPEEVY